MQQKKIKTNLNNFIKKNIIFYLKLNLYIEMKIFISVIELSILKKLFRGLFK